MRAILATFLAASLARHGLGLPDETAQAVVGVYGALIYLVALRVSTPQKFGFALVMVGLSFVVMAVAAALAGAGKVSVGDAVGGQTGRLGRVLSDPMHYLVLAAMAVVAGLALFMFTRTLWVRMAEHHESVIR
ncbi:hypothetical protein [Nonomuraea sp. JJY05]|uniref:hypothetical protein n=1 Tax=Nonomuraea sp. JJY05 TaxID=3350255 RepID=UPI00373DFF38